MSNTTHEKFSDYNDKETADITFLVMKMETKLNKKGDPFVEIEASDGDAFQVVRLWNKAVEDVDFTVGDVLTASVTSNPYNGSLSYAFNSYRKEPRERAVEFVRSAPEPIEEMWEWIERRTYEMREPYKTFIELMILSRKDEFCHASAARSNHHNYVGGLLYHSYRMAQSADVLAEIYGADADLCVAGALLHDIGKLIEMDTDVLGNVEYTVRGQMEGHLMIGYDMVRECASKMPRDLFDSDEAECLVHIIASHHGKQEMGAVREPMFKEAMIVSAVDMLDMKLTVYDEEAAPVAIGQMSANYNPIVGKVYVPSSSARAKLKR